MKFAQQVGIAWEPIFKFCLILKIYNSWKLDFKLLNASYNYHKYSC